MNKTTTKRKKLRLPGYDYALPGGYFVTISAHQRGDLFGVAEEGEVNLNRIGKIIQVCWLEIPNHCPNVILDEFIVMPDHFHGILIINYEDVGARHASPRIKQSQRATHASSLQTKSDSENISLGVIVGSFKSAATKKVNQFRNSPGQKLWQRGYYDRIIRNQDELNKIRNYIINNPGEQELLDFLDLYSEVTHETRT